MVTSTPWIVHRDEGQHLVERPLHEELHLAVLVGGADGRHRRRTGEDLGAAPVAAACPGSPPRAAGTTPAKSRSRSQYGMST